MDNGPALTALFPGRSEGGFFHLPVVGDGARDGRIRPEA